MKRANRDSNDSVPTNPVRRRQQDWAFRPFGRLTYFRKGSRDKLNLDLGWLNDDSLEDIDNLPEPDVLATEITENLEAALESFSEVAGELKGRS